VVQEYEQLDRRTLATLCDLFRQLGIALLFNWARVEQLGHESFCFVREDFEDEEEFDTEWDVHLELVHQVLAWRGLKLADHVGRLMKRYADTHVERGNPWVAWRQGAGRGIVSQFVRELTQDDFIAALAARNIHLAVNFPDAKVPLTHLGHSTTQSGRKSFITLEWVSSTCVL